MVVFNRQEFFLVTKKPGFGEEVKKSRDPRRRVSKFRHAS